MGRLLAGVSFLGTPSTGHPDVADGSTTALTNGDGFRPVAGPAARTRRRRAQETLGREFYEVLTRQGRRRPVTPVAAARRRWLPLRRGPTSHASLRWRKGGRFTAFDAVRARRTATTSTGPHSGRRSGPVGLNQAPGTAVTYSTHRLACGGRVRPAAAALGPRSRNFTSSSGRRLDAVRTASKIKKKPRKRARAARTPTGSSRQNVNRGRSPAPPPRRTPRRAPRRPRGDTPKRAASRSACCTRRSLCGNQNFTARSC